MSIAPKSITVTQKHGVPPSVLLSFLQTKFSIPLSHQHLLRSYFIRYWSKEYLLSTLEAGKGTLTRENIQFIAIYRDCSRGKILSSSEDQVCLSFRAALPEYNLPAYVLISPVNVLNSPERIVHKYLSESQPQHKQSQQRKGF